MNHKLPRNFLNSFVVLAIVTVVFILNSGTVRKKEDPIRDTQTDPIAYNKKMEEIKDGEKGAPTPSFQYYGGEPFLKSPPVDKKPIIDIESLKLIKAAEPEVIDQAQNGVGYESDFEHVFSDLNTPEADGSESIEGETTKSKDEEEEWASNLWK